MVNLDPRQQPAPPDTSQLYAKRKAVYPRPVDGRFRRIKWLVMAVTLAIYYFIVGVIVILLKGIVTERITAFMARRQGVEL